MQRFRRVGRILLALCIMLALQAPVLAKEAQTSSPGQRANATTATDQDRSTTGLRYDDLPDANFGAFATLGRKWPYTDLTYNFKTYNGFQYTPDLSNSQVESAIAEALGLWAAVTPLTFTRTSGTPDIWILFAAGEHGDGSPFDGPGNLLAHAYYPPVEGSSPSPIEGDAHFDEAETWTVNQTSGIDLVTVAAHEFGHSLGLDHSADVNALMYAYYGGPARYLRADDIAGIQNLYGAASQSDTHDGQIISVSAPTSATQGDSVSISVVVKNNGNVTDSIPVSVTTSPGGFSQNQTASDVAAGQSKTLTFSWSTSTATQTGNYIIQATSILSGDQNGSNNSGTATLQINASNSGGNGMYVSRIIASVPDNGYRYYPRARVYIAKQGQSISGVDVTLRITGPGLNQTLAGTTNSQGYVYLYTTGYSGGTFRFTVLSVSKRGEVYDASQNVETSVSINTDGSAPPPPPPPPATHDAAIISASAPATVANGASAVVSITVKNNGSATDTISVSASESPDGRSGSTTLSLAAGAQTTTTITLTPSGAWSAGTHNLNVTATVAGDNNSANNTQPANFNVEAPPPPADDHDAAVTDIRATSSVTQGQPVSIEVDVFNDGNVTDSFNVTVSAPSAGFSQARTASAVAPGQTRTVSLTWSTDSTTPVANHTLTASVSVGADSDSSNNSRSTVVQVNSDSGGGGGEPQAGVIYVQRIIATVPSNGYRYYPRARVYISKDGQSVSGARVTLRVTGPGLNQTLVNTTNSQGYAYLYTTGYYSGTYTFRILDVSKSGETYDPASNVEKSVTIRS